MKSKPSKTEKFLVVSGAVFLAVGFLLWVFGIGIIYGFDSIVNWLANSREAKITYFILGLYALFLVIWFVHRLIGEDEK